jgi:integrase
MFELCHYITKVGMPDEGRVFPITSGYAWSLVKKAGKAAGLGEIHPHTFRHSSAIRMIRADNTMTGLLAIKDRFDHKSLDSTAWYLKFADRAEAKKIEEIFG